MTNLRKQPLTLVVSIALCCTLLVACEEKVEEAPVVVAPAPEPIKRGIEDPAYAQVSGDYTVVDLTIKNLLNTIKLSLKANNLLNKEKKACIDKIDTTIARLAMQNFLIGEFTPDELMQLNEFFKTKPAIKYSEYSSQQTVIASGTGLTRVIEPLNGRKIKEIKAFIETPLGKKYIQVMQNQDTNNVVNVLMPLLTREFKNCEPTS